MRKVLFLSLIVLNICFTSYNLFAQNTGIGTTSPSPNALLHLENNGLDLGLILPNVDITGFTPLATDIGLMVYDSVLDQINIWDGSAWQSAGAASLQNAYAAGQTVSMNFGNIDFISSAANSVLYIDEANERIGIRNNTPLYALDLNGGNINVDLTHAYLQDGQNLISRSPLNDNLRIGPNSGLALTTGTENILMGFGTGNSIQDGNSNIAFGFQALPNTVDGGFNVAIGRLVGLLNTSGTANIGIGGEALHNNVSGDENIGIGVDANYSNSTGNRNIAIGAGAGVISTNLNNAIAIGALSRVDADNSMVLGMINGVGPGTADVSVGIGTPTPNQNSSLDLGHNDRGLQLNRVDTTTIQPLLGLTDHGLIVYDTVVNHIFVWNGANFESAGSSSGANDTIPANVFSVRVQNNGAATILSQSQSFVQSAVRTGLGAVTVTFVPGFFTQAPAVSATVNSVAGPVDASAVNVTSSGCIITTGQTGAAGSDWDFTMIVQRQGADYQNTLTAPPNVVGLWETNGTDIYYDTSFVGIGTNTPLSQLNVEADVLTNASVARFINTNTGSQLGTAIYASSENSAAGFGYGVIAVGNYLGVDAFGSAGGFAGLRAQSVGATYALEVLGHPSSTAGMHIDANGATYGAIIENGNIGIGTTTPSAQIELGSTLNNRKIVLFEGADNDHQFFGFGVNPAELRYQVNGNFASHVFYSSINTTSSLELMRILGNGNVGIGVNAPQEKLHISSSAISTSVIVTNDAVGLANTDGLLIGENNAGVAVINNRENERFLIGTNGNLGQMLLDPSGNVGIAQATPIYRLDVLGTVRSGGNGQDGQMRIFSEQGATDFEVIFDPNPAMTANTTYTLPADDGAASDVLTTDGNGLLSWGSASGLIPDNGLSLTGNDLDLGGTMNQNTILDRNDYAFVIGTNNTIAGPQNAELILGFDNTITGFGGIAIGTGNTVGGNRGTALGNFVQANHLGSFVIGDWSGSGPGLTASSTSDQFTARFNAGYRFYADSDPIANPNTGMFMNNAGFVGIGTSNPAATLDVQANDAIIIPDGTNAQRPAPTVGAGAIRYNTDIGVLEYSDGSNWHSLVPPGTIVAFGGGVAPEGWLFCNGAFYDRTTYSKLFAAIGSAWGTTNATNFRVPDARGKFLRGVDGGANYDPDRASRIAQYTGGNGGDAVGSLQFDAFQNHQHQSNINHNVFGTGPFSTQATSGGAVSGGTSLIGPASNIAGNKTSTETRPVNINVNYIIKY